MAKVTNEVAINTNDRAYILRDGNTDGQFDYKEDKAFVDRNGNGKRGVMDSRVREGSRREARMNDGLKVQTIDGVVTDDLKTYSENLAGIEMNRTRSLASRIFNHTLASKAKQAAENGGINPSDDGNTLIDSSEVKLITHMNERKEELSVSPTASGSNVGIRYTEPQEVKTIISIEPQDE
jgi:hypothetical protein